MYEHLYRVLRRRAVYVPTLASSSVIQAPCNVRNGVEFEIIDRQVASLPLVLRPEFPINSNAKQ